ncbi:(2Fe-2S)-binding protein [Candidatus Bathyarchaeota archaeon]|nr:(2Fe-2S)-binding protein [Candidatus Bathyarchaeota archaeon]MBS7631437.1 (2Fe-2S)-binding protein [Candidatus Bathyarchaeota archaeon]
MKVELTINRRKGIFEVEPNELLINLLREKIRLTGTKYGCGIGMCGACTVLLDGEPVLACLTLAVDADGGEVETIEGVAREGKLDDLQEAFLEEGAVQCGYCTPGFIMTAKALLNENPSPSEDEIRGYLKGNYCRCTGYVNIIKAVQRAAEKRKRIGKQEI